jgi:hypothetical protein
MENDYIPCAAGLHIIHDDRQSNSHARSVSLAILL